MQVGFDLLDGIVVVERSVTGEHVVERAAEAVDIGADVGPVGVLGLLGSDVIRRSHDDADLREPIGVTGGTRVGGRIAVDGKQGPGRCAFHDEAGQAEVEDLHLAARRQHKVLWFNIAMDHAAFMGVLEAEGHLPRVGTRLGHGERAVLGAVASQADALHEFHDQKMHVAGLLGIECGHNVGVR